MNISFDEADVFCSLNNCSQFEEKKKKTIFGETAHRLANSQFIRFDCYIIKMVPPQTYTLISLHATFGCSMLPQFIYFTLLLLHHSAIHLISNFNFFFLCCSLYYYLLFAMHLEHYESREEMKMLHAHKRMNQIIFH